MSANLPPDNDQPEDGQPDQVTPQAPAAAPGGERTVMASPEALAAALRGQGGSVTPPVSSAPEPFAPESLPPSFTPPADPFASSYSQPPANQEPPATIIGMLPSNEDQLIGVQLNELFEVVRFIAQGGMGRVYEGRNIASGEQVAIKVILSQYAADNQFMALFRREASALEKIGHDALVKYRALAFDRGRGINYLVIEFVNGPSMAHMMTGVPGDPAMVRRVLRRLAQGLHAAHEAGVIHRDLSPDNVLLPGGNIDRAKIIDFGIAKDNNPGQKSVVGDAFAGKFGYAAPEVFGKYGRRVGAWTDIYSLGLVIAALARGVPVEMGVTIVDALEARDTVPDLSGVSADLLPIITKMLAPDPADRFQTMEEVAEAADPRGTLFTASPAPSPAPAPAAPAFVKADAAPATVDKPKGKLPIPALAAVAVVVIAGGAWLALSGPGKPAADPGAAPVEAADVAAAAPAAGPEAVTSAANWATSAPQVFAALGQLRCAEVRVDGLPQGGRVRLTGWRSSATPVPASAGGWQLDSSGVAAVAGPSVQACRVADSIRDAAASSPDSRLRMPGSQILSLASLPAGTGPGSILLDLKVTDRPAGNLWLASIDDRATTPDGLVVSADVDRNGIDVGGIEFDRKPGRYLVMLVSSPTALPDATAAGASPRMASICRGGACRLTSGWIEVR
ncbi:MAG: protein kinase domain-containing protein [Sandarakinorhabdus sp.]